jgi:hypothetical protein
LNLAHVNLGETPINIWHSILTQAQHHHKVEALMEVAREEYPGQPWPATQERALYHTPATPPRPLSQAEQRELARALLVLPSMADGARRRDVIAELRDEIATKIPASSVDNMHVLNIVKTCLQYENGLEELLEILSFSEGNSLPMQQVEATVKRLRER